MRIKLSELRKFIREAIEVAIEDVDRLRRADDKDGDDVEESVDRINRNKHGYGDSEFDESVDRVKRNEAGYGDSLFDESLTDTASLEEAAPTDKEEDWREKNEADFKKRYGKAYKDRLYSKAKEKFRK